MSLVSTGVRWATKHRLWLCFALLMIIAVLRGLVWIGSYPALKITDEPSHFDNIQYRAEHHLHAPRPKGAAIEKVFSKSTSFKLRRAWHASNFYFREKFHPWHKRVPEEAELAELALKVENRLTDGQSTSMFYPGVYYGLGVVPYNLFRRASVLYRIFALRVYSLLFGLLLVGCTFFAAYWVAGSLPLAFATGLFVTLQPLAAQQTVGINNDAGVAGLCAAIFLVQLALVRAMPRRPSVPLFLLLAILTALAIQTKPHAWAMVPGSIFIAAWAIWTAPRDRRTWLVLGAGLALYFTTHTVCTALLDRADPLLAATGSSTGPGAASAAFAPIHGWPMPPLWGFVQFIVNLDSDFYEYLFQTGWGAYCWLDVWLPGRWINDLHFGALLLWLGAAAAIARRTLRPDDAYEWNGRLAIFTTSTALASFFVVLFAEYFSRVNLSYDHMIQGRAFLFALPSFGSIGAVAFSALFPRRFHMLAAALAIIAMILVACGALLTVIEFQYVG